MDSSLRRRGRCACGRWKPSSDCLPLGARPAGGTDPRSIHQPRTARRSLFDKEIGLDLFALPVDVVVKDLPLWILLPARAGGGEYISFTTTS